MYQRTTQEPCFAFDDGKMFVDDTCFMLISKEAKYLQATLSSKLFEFAYKTLFSSIQLGEKGYQYNKYALIKLPVAVPSKKTEQQIGKLLKDKDYETIDNLIYELYTLNQEEIEFIEKH